MNRIRGSLVVTVVVWSAISAASPDVAACDGELGGWSWTESQLVAHTPEIFVGRVVDARSNETDPFRDYLFEVVESIKGAAQPPLRWLGPFRYLQPDAGTSGAGRVTVTPACGIAVSFQTGRQYLVFRDSNHPKGYELVASDNDAWLKTVRRLAKSTAAAATLPR